MDALDEGRGASLVNYIHVQTSFIDPLSVYVVPGAVILAVLLQFHIRLRHVCFASKLYLARRATNLFLTVFLPI